ncbi:unnamed protein product, partial [marine sediment metagenome]
VVRHQYQLAFSLGVSIDKLPELRDIGEMSRLTH